jgi:pyruvate/2-oxoglutarate/acetoin dehydrogenase E1 component
MLDTATAVRELTFGDAIKEAIAEEMRRDPKVVLMGEDVAEAGTTFKVLTGLVDEFGKDRIIDTPISEAGFTGIGVGAAMAGMRPIVDIMFGDFLMIIMDQVANQAAKIHYMSGWQVEGPARHPRDDGRHATVRGAALAVAARVAEPHSGLEGRGAVDAVRREGSLQSGGAR